MAEFRRLISYIYEYEGNVKGKNVGFVKLETRNNMCRLNVSVKKLYMGSSDMGVYLLAGRQEIFLGNIFLRNGCGEFRTMVQVADVQETGEKLDECYGLTLHGKTDRWRVYTTIWEDAVAQAAQLTLESVTADNVLEREAKGENLSPMVHGLPADSDDREEMKAASLSLAEAPAEKSDQALLPPGFWQEEQKEAEELEVPEEQKVSGEQKTPEEWEIPEKQRTLEEWEISGKQRSPEVLEMSKPDREPERKTSGSAKKEADPLKERQKEQTGQSSREEPEEEPAVNGALTRGQIQKIVQRQENWLADHEGKKETEEKKNVQKKPFQGETLPDFEMGQLEWETRHPNIPFGQKTQEGGKAAQTVRQPLPEKNQPIIHQQKEQPLIIGDPEALAKLDAEEVLEKQVPVWDFFSKTYPKIQAFDSEYGCQILVIKPQDIGLLPREIWIYGNNSFLLHGYYNYRYLILARVENPKGLPRYLLGVPGHYFSNEKYMASMFGFPHFVLSKRQPAQDGRFGYWYTDIRMEESAILGMGAVRKGNVKR